MDGNSKSRYWLKFLAILAVAVIVALVATFVPGDAPQQKLLRVAIEIAAFAILLFGLRLWPSLVRGKITTKKWVRFFAVMLVIYLTGEFLLRPYLDSHPSVERIIAHVFSTVGPEWLPAIIVPLVIIYYLLFKRHKSNEK